MKRTVIIAEIGECWNGDVEQAKKMISIAADAGCDYVKFQTLDSTTVKEEDPERDWFLKVALSEQLIECFIDEAKLNTIKPLFTPANINKARLLRDKFGLDEVKIASSVFHDNETVAYIARHFDKIFASTGMCSLEEIEKKLQLFNGNNQDVFLLHCISEYPTGPLLKRNGLRALSEADVHLNMMTILKERFPQCEIGYSDHTVGLLAPICAVAAGAAVIEKHFTLDRDLPRELYETGSGYLGTDHVLSLEPDELREMVKAIRQVERIFGSEGWSRTDGELQLMDFLVKRF